MSDSGYDPASYGQRVGVDYDTLYPGDATETSDAVALLASLAHASGLPSVLELGIGTGRLAIPLAQQPGLSVAGIDGSATMLAALEAKSKSAKVEIAAILGDYRDTLMAGESFGVVLLAFNGIFDPRGLEAQLDIFGNAARHLVPGGLFVVESWVMPEDHRTGEWSVLPRYVTGDHVELQFTKYDLETHQLERLLLHLLPGGSHSVAVRDTYASPRELDIMAHTTGFTRTQRYSTWGLAPFTSTSGRHISVYRKTT